ncbi:MAG: hemolysin family protein [Flavobacteriia bacterium]|jgi:putative hemolysin
MNPSLQVFIILLSLVFCAFFSGMEIAFLSSSRLKVELEKSKRTPTGRILNVFYKKESFFIALLLLANIIALVIFGVNTADLLDPVISAYGIKQPYAVLLIQTVIASLLILVLAEFLPKVFVQINPNGFLRFSAPAMFVIYVLLFIPTQFVMAFSTLVLRLLKTERSRTEKVFSKVDLEHYVQDLSSRIKEEEELGNEMEILQNALDFSNIKARDCMIPRTDIVALDVDEEITILRQTFIDKGLSKILIYRDSVDHIIGYVHSHEMFKMPSSIKQVLLPITFVPSAMAGNELLELFSKQTGNLAVVVDEYGGTAGLVTLEDVIEEIFGEIRDEHDKEEGLEEKINDNEYRFSARLDIDYLNETYHLELPESDEYETLGGLIIHELESIPEAGKLIEFEGLTISIDEVSDRRIEIVRIILH